MRLCRGRSVARLLFVSALCCGVILQMLGVPVTFWDLDDTADFFSTSLLEGFAVPSNGPMVFPWSRAVFAAIVGERLYYSLSPPLVFHPPLPLR